MTQRVLQQLKMRNPILVERYEFAVDHGVALYAFESLRDLNVVVTDDLAVAAMESDPSAFDLRNHPKSVELVFKDPLVIIERFIRQCGEHRLEAFRQGGRPAHAYASLSSTLRNVIE